MTFLSGIQQRLAPMQIADMIAQMLPPRRLRDMQRSGLDHTRLKKFIHETFVVAIRNDPQGKQIAQSFYQCIERADKKVKYTIDQREQSTSNKLKKQKELDLKKEREKIDLKKDKDELKKLNNGITKQSISLKADTNFVRLQSDSEEEEDEEDEALMLAMALSMSRKKRRKKTKPLSTKYCEFSQNIGNVSRTKRRRRKKTKRRKKKSNDKRYFRSMVIQMCLFVS